MKQYIVKYISHDDDLCTVWLSADSREEALQTARAEYHDIKDIIKAEELK